MSIAELVENGSGDDVVRELLAHVVDRLMEFEIEQRTNVPKPQSRMSPSFWRLIAGQACEFLATRGCDSIYPSPRVQKGVENDIAVIAKQPTARLERAASPFSWARGPMARRLHRVRMRLADRLPPQRVANP